MSGRLQSTEDNLEARSGTLGAVLYANKSEDVRRESDWASLIREIALGDQLALHALYERAHRVVFTLTMRITNSHQTAEELTIDVFHDVWRYASKYEPADGTVLGWILNQARSRAIDRVRFESRQKRLTPQSEDWRQWTAPTESDAAIALEQRRERVRKALSSLDANEREAIEIAYFSDLTYGQVAARLNQPLGTVKTRIRSGFGKLREALAGEEER